MHRPVSLKLFYLLPPLPPLEPPPELLDELPPENPPPEELLLELPEE